MDRISSQSLLSELEKIALSPHAKHVLRFGAVGAGLGLASAYIYNAVSKKSDERRFGEENAKLVRKGRKFTYPLALGAYFAHVGHENFNSSRGGYDNYVPPDPESVKVDLPFTPKWESATTKKDAQKAFRQHMMDYHPDRNPGADPTVSRDLNIAWEAFKRGDAFKKLSHYRGMTSEYSRVLDFIRNHGI